MNKKIFFIFVFLIHTMSDGHAGKKNCKDLKKFSVEYFKCKGNLVKDKTISVGKNIIKDTKDYQKKEWSEEKEKVEKVKNKIKKVKEKVIE